MPGCVILFCFAGIFLRLFHDASMCGFFRHVVGQVPHHVPHSHGTAILPFHFGYARHTILLNKHDPPLSANKQSIAVDVQRAVANIRVVVRHFPTEIETTVTQMITSVSTFLSF